jgi:hypothetical protein
MNRPPSPLHRKPSDTSAAVDRFMTDSNHPLKTAILALRTLIRGVHPDIQEGIKWNAPSYRMGEYFATTNLRDKTGVGIILHLGAKVKDHALAIDDPQHLLTWLGSDRAALSFRDAADVQRHATAVSAILAQWITYLEIR